MADIEKILEEASVNYKSAANSGNENADLKNLIDAYYDADKAEKDAKKQKSAIRSDIDSAIEGMEIGGCLMLDGNEHRLQIVEKHSYTLNQSKCDGDSSFNVAFNRGKLSGIEKNISLKIVPSEFDAVVKALMDAGLGHVVNDIKHEWIFSGKAEDARKLMESVEDVNLRDFVEDSVTVQISAKK